MRYTALVLLIVLMLSISAVQKNASAETSWEIYKVDYHGQLYKIPSNIINGEIKEMKKDQDFASLIVFIETHPSDDGLLEIIIPRELLNQDIRNPVDDELIVLVNGEEIDGNEVSSLCSRTLSIPFAPGPKEIEIIATELGWPMDKPPPLTFAIGKHDYEVGESITVSGRTCSFVDEDVLIEVLNPEGELYKKLSVTPTGNSFSASVVVEGENAINGTYTLKAAHGKQTASTTFVVPEFPVSIIIFATAVSLIFVTRFIPDLKIRNSTNQLTQT